MEPLVKVLKLVDQDKKPTLSVIYEVMDRDKLAIKASVKHWKRYWEVVDIRGQINCIDICTLQVIQKIPYTVIIILFKGKVL